MNTDVRNETVAPKRGRRPIDAAMLALQESAKELGELRERCLTLEGCARSLIRDYARDADLDAAICGLYLLLGESLNLLVEEVAN